MFVTRPATEEKGPNLFKVPLDDFILCTLPVIKSAYMSNERVF